MLCPFINKTCIQSECVMWADDLCVIAAGALHYCANITRLPKEPKTILEACARHHHHSSISALSRREVDDYLASSNLALDSLARRSLMKTLRYIKKMTKQSNDNTSSEWRNRDDNRGKAWSSDEDLDARTSYANGMSIEEIAAAHKRTALSIQAHLERTGLIPINE